MIAIIGMNILELVMKLQKKAIEYSKDSSNKIKDARKKNSNKYQLILK